MISSPVAGPGSESRRHVRFASPPLQADGAPFEEEERQPGCHRHTILLVNGEPFRGEVHVQVGTDGLFVVEERGLRVERGRALPILLERRVDRWLQLLDLEQRLVSGADFENEFRVRSLPPR
jgi:hypothetical protein